jgi:uncharacterized phage protein (TIGR01671 family)
MDNRYLFKAKRLDNGEWVQGALIYDDMDKLYRMIIELDYSTGTCIRAGKAPRVDVSTICQCTGLKDKNGKLIWENDVVKDEEGNFYKTIWQNNYYQFFSWIRVKSEIPQVDGKGDSYLLRSVEIEVIGNIFDNKELLESER